MKTEKFDKSHFRSPMIDGPWNDEPDKANWVDESTGLDCMIVRNPFGALCGYVGVDSSHRFFGEDYDKHYDLECHGGLTYSEDCQEGGVVCHVPEPGRPEKIWWFGFDCLHVDDFAPCDIGMCLNTATYKTFEYVKAQVTSLAGQIADQRS